MAKTFLITGGTGYLGSHTVKRLVEQGNRVIVLDNGSRGDHNRLKSIDHEFIHGDVREESNLFLACYEKRIDSVIHFASINGTRNFYEKPDLVLEVATRGILNLLKVCSNYGIKEFFLISSSEVYQTPDQIPTPEIIPLSIPDPLNPRYSYACGKIVSEMMVLHSKELTKAVVVRPHNIYGPEMPLGHVISDKCLQITKASHTQKDGILSIPLVGSGEETRSFCHVDDFTDGMMLAIDKGEHRNIYHIGTEEEVSISDLIQSIGVMLGREVSLQTAEYFIGGTNRRCPDISKMRKLGYSPKIELFEGLFETVTWFKDNYFRYEGRS